MSSLFSQHFCLNYCRFVHVSLSLLFLLLLGNRLLSGNANNFLFRPFLKFHIAKITHTIIGGGPKLLFTFLSWFLCEMEAQSKHVVRTHTHIAHTFLHLWRRFACAGAHQQKTSASELGRRLVNSALLVGYRLNCITATSTTEGAPVVVGGVSSMERG